VRVSPTRISVDVETLHGVSTVLDLRQINDGPQPPSNEAEIHPSKISVRVHGWHSNVTIILFWWSPTGLLKHLRIMVVE
jgi:hypothetical protein